MDNPATMNLHNLREHISNLEFRRDKLGCGKDVIDRLNAARTELSSRMKRTPAERESGRGQPGPEPPIPLGLPESRDGSERPVFKIKACCLICANGKPKEGAVLCKYSTGAYREGWYCKRFLQRHIETE